MRYGVRRACVCSRYGALYQGFLIIVLGVRHERHSRSGALAANGVTVGEGCGGGTNRRRSVGSSSGCCARLGLRIGRVRIQSGARPVEERWSFPGAAWGG